MDADPQRAGLRVLYAGLEQPDPEMIAAAWTVMRDRWPGSRLGPGPAFTEAMQAMGRVLLPHVTAVEARLRALCDAAQAVIDYDGDQIKPPYIDLLLTLEAEVARARPTAPITTDTGEGA